MQRISMVFSEDQVDTIMAELEVRYEDNATNQDLAIEALGDSLRTECNINLHNGFIEYHRTWKPNWRWQDDGNDNYLRCPFTIVFLGNSGPDGKLGRFKGMVESL